MKSTQADTIPASGVRTCLAAVARRVEEGFFLTFVTLSLIIPSPITGPFGWLPIVRIPGIEQAPVAVGPLILLPGLALTAWAAARAFEHPSHPWHWGKPGITRPLAALSLLMLLSLEPTLTRRTSLVLLVLGLLWWFYLYVINESPDLTTPLTLVILLQSGIALGQFAVQGDLGLQALGEPLLDVQQSGTCVLFARGQRWLRAYGLSGHPNLLGALLSVLLLLVVDDIVEARGWARVWFTLIASAGLLGLLVTFSRNAWLAFCLGLAAWLLRQGICRRRRQNGDEQRPLFSVADILRRHAHLAAPVALALLFLLFHLDLVGSRFLHLETPIEARSVAERTTDASLALRLIAKHPWRGVGVNNYLVAVRAIEADSRTVHNILLLVAAELGLPGAALWVWLTLEGLARPLTPGWAAWIALLITGVFDIALFPTTSWYAAGMFGLLAAHTSAAQRTAGESQAVDRA